MKTIFLKRDAYQNSHCPGCGVVHARKQRKENQHANAGNQLQYSQRELESTQPCDVNLGAAIQGGIVVSSVW